METNNKDPIKWYSEKVYVDIETGEILTESEVQRNYIIIKKSKFYELKEGTGRNGSRERRGVIKWHNECERNKQQRLEF